MAEQEKINQLRVQLLVTLQKKELRDTSYNIARLVVKFFRDVIVVAKAKNVNELITLLKQLGESLYPSIRTEFLIRNMLCATLKMVREEGQKLVFGVDDLAATTDSLNKLWIGPTEKDGGVDNRKLRQAIIAAIDEFLVELETSRENMANQAPYHVPSTDTVLTHKFSSSKTLQEFFESTKCCLWSVDDSSTNPKMKANVISSMDILSVMGKVNRVVLSAAAILPDGSCVASAGTLNICLAAKRHAVPVLVCAAFYKLTPTFLPSADDYNTQRPVTEVLPFTEAFSLPSVQVANPLFDKIPAQLITLYITQTSAISPSHIYRLVGDYYHPEDFHELIE
jgi:translation initiation factor eIF-2B subunit beta